MGDQPVSQRLFDEVCKRYDDQIKQLREDVAALERRRDEERNASWLRRIGAVGAGAAVASAWVALIELMHSSGR